jgi:DNA-binding response OmpR family regulator
MLVSARPCDEVEKSLVTSGCAVAKVEDGQAAVFRVRRENFDAAVLLSTGAGMDLTETAFNLSDIRRSIQIIIVADRHTDSRKIIAQEMILQSVPKTLVVTAEGLKDLVASLNGSRRTGAKGASARKMSR